MRKCPPILILFLCIVAFDVSDALSQPEDRISWSDLSEDLETASLTVPTSFISSARIDLFRTSLKKFDLKVIRSNSFGEIASTAKEMCESADATLCINASFFDENHKPLGLIIQKGNTFQKIHRGGNTLTGILQRTKDSVAIVHRLDFAPGKTLEAIQAGPRLISSGSPVNGINERSTSHRRSGVCIDPDHRLVFYTVNSVFFGLPISTLQKVLLHRDIACWDALNLDGGSSTQLYYAGSQRNDLERAPFELKGEDVVPVVLALVSKE